ncbi:hypothetical protein PR048_012564 [Dryococelus australis]|uniref:Uncharacterized protein n=1 Tax=Dryococelus australis TaxID=614101 RepID=A0ABQ9HPR2_9NEOP|nr:hypothetical protein PR048_012564 [Dryococelus australis]
MKTQCHRKLQKDAANIVKNMERNVTPILALKQETAFCMNTGQLGWVMLNTQLSEKTLRETIVEKVHSSVRYFDQAETLVKEELLGMMSITDQSAEGIAKKTGCLHTVCTRYGQIHRSRV